MDTLRGLDRAGPRRRRWSSGSYVLAAAWAATPRLVVAVSNEVGSGIVPAYALGGRLFRDLMGRVDTAVAHHSDTVLWCVAGRITAL